MTADCGDADFADEVVCYGSTVWQQKNDANIKKWSQCEASHDIVMRKDHHEQEIPETSEHVNIVLYLPPIEVCIHYIEIVINPSQKAIGSGVV